MLSNLIVAIVVGIAMYVVTTIIWHATISAWKDRANLVINRKLVVKQFWINMGWYAIAAMTVVTKIWGQGETTSAEVALLFCLAISAVIYTTRFMTRLDVVTGDLDSVRRMHQMYN